MTTRAAHPAEGVFVPHTFPEKQVDLGEIEMNYVEVGSPDNPALLLIPEQTGSWWSYEASITLLSEHFHVFAVDLRGQGRSTWTPKRYSLDNFGNDLVRFIAQVIQRPVVVSGCSSGGVLAAWLSAYAMPGQIRGAVCEDAPLFSSELTPAYGHGIRQGAGPFFELYRNHLGDQWSINDWDGFIAATKVSPHKIVNFFPPSDEPPQNIKEYDPEWARVFYEGTVALHCPHDQMLAQVKTPILLTQHAHHVDPDTGDFLGSVSDDQIRRARDIIDAAGCAVELEVHPDAAHMMHLSEPERFSEIVTKWAASLPA